MTLEASDLNDGAILQSTRQVAGTNDTVKFIITLPSGREFSSEYFQNERKREALHGWLQAVRQQVVFESEESEAAARRAFFEKQALEKRQQSELIVPVQSQPAEPPRSSGIVDPRVQELDALAHAKRMLASAAQRRGAAAAAHAAATTELGEAERNLSKWGRILAALEAPESE